MSEALIKKVEEGVKENREALDRLDEAMRKVDEHQAQLSRRLDALEADFKRHKESLREAKGDLAGLGITLTNANGTTCDAKTYASDEPE